MFYVAKKIIFRSGYRIENIEKIQRNHRKGRKKNGWVFFWVRKKCHDITYLIAHIYYICYKRTQTVKKMIDFFLFTPRSIMCDNDSSEMISIVSGICVKWDHKKKELNENWTWRSNDSNRTKLSIKAEEKRVLGSS